MMAMVFLSFEYSRINLFYCRLNSSSHVKQYVHQIFNWSTASGPSPSHKPYTNNESLEIRHIGFLKVHKAGSTTIQNILFRFGLKRNLAFVLPKIGPYLSTGILPIKPGIHYDILASHTAYKKSLFDRLLPKDKVNIAIVREPMDRMISAAFYYRDVYNHQYLKKIPGPNFIEKLLLQPDTYDKKPFSPTRNSMGFDFGFESGAKPQSTNATLNTLKLLDKELKLVMVMEKFDESLVMLKRYLGWKMEDIIYLRGNSHKHDKIDITDEQRAKHKETCFLDYAIYDYFTERFRERVAAEGLEFQKEVELFQSYINKTQSFCANTNANTNTNNKTHFSASNWNSEFVITRDDCEQMKLPEPKFLDQLRQRHKKLHGSK